MTGGGSTRRLRAEFWAIGTVLTTLVLTAWNGMLAFRADRASASLILGAAIGSLLLAAAVNGVAWLASRGARRTRTAAVRVALAAGIAVAAYGLLRELTASANVSTLVRIARFASPVLAGAVWGSFLDPLLRRHARRVLRRRRSPGRSLWAPLTGLALLIAGATAVIGLRGGTGEEGALLREGVRPTRRLWIVGVDGIDQRGLARWVALNSQSAIGRLALAGASAYVAWDAEGGAGWEALLRGEPWPEDPVGPAGSPPGAAGWQAGLRSVWGGTRAGTPADEGLRPTLWEVAERAGLRTVSLGFDGALAASAGVQVPDSTYAWARDIWTGEREGPITVPHAGQALRWARPPWTDWRRGATLTGPEAALRQASDALGVDIDGAWRDRFFAQAAWHAASSIDHEVMGVKFTYPLRLEAAKDVSDLQGPAAVREAVGHYLASFDAFVAELSGRLRAGDTLVLLFAPAPSPFGPGQGATGTGLAVLFGEKIRPQSAEGETVTTADVTQTLVYLLGLKRSRALKGTIVWGLLAEGAEQRFVPETVARYTPS